MKYSTSVKENGWSTLLRISLFCLCLSLPTLGETADAQTAVPRHFQMSVWGNEQANSDSDIPMVFENDIPPATGPYILELINWSTSNYWVNDILGYPSGTTPAVPYVSQQPSWKLDFSRIAAVLVDEPYLSNSGVSNILNDSACPSSSDPNYAAVQGVQTTLANLMEAVKSTQGASKVRFWINFSVPEIQYMKKGCAPLLNSKYVSSDGGAYYADVVSIDNDGPTETQLFDAVISGIDTLHTYYNWLSSTPAYYGQQIALVPPTYIPYPYEVTNDLEAAANLTPFYNYANELNQTCTLPLGGAGQTEIFDGCPVWIVAGWFYQDGNPFDGRLGENVPPDLHSAWTTERGAAIDDPVVGNVNSIVTSGPNLGQISGWACDRDATNGQLDLDVYIDGTYTGSATTVIGSNSPPLYQCTTAGFTYNVPSKYWDNKPHQLNVWALNTQHIGGGGGALLLPGMSSFILSAPSTYATGWATIDGNEQSKIYYVGAQNSPVTIYDAGTVTIAVNGCSASAGYGQASTDSSVASSLGAAVNSSCGSYVTATVTGATISLTAKTAGSAGDYSLSGSGATSVTQGPYGEPGFSSASFSPGTSGSSLTGGTP